MRTLHFCKVLVEFGQIRSKNSGNYLHLEIANRIIRGQKNKMLEKINKANRTKMKDVQTKKRFHFRWVWILSALLVFLVLPASLVSASIEGLFELGPGINDDEGGVTNLYGIVTDSGPDWADLFNANGEVIPGAVESFGGLDAVFIPAPSALHDTRVV